MSKTQRCISCGDPIGGPAARELPDDFRMDGRQALELSRLRRTYCLDCAMEIAFGIVDTSPPKTQFDCGGGRRVIRDPRGLGG